MLRKLTLVPIAFAALTAGCRRSKGASSTANPGTGAVAVAPMPPRLVPSATDGKGRAAHFLDPEGVVYDGAGNLFVADTGNHILRKVVVATGVVTTLAGSPGQKGSTDGKGSAALFRGPSGIAYDGAGVLYVSSGFAIRKVVVATGEVTTLAGSPEIRGSADGKGGDATFSYPRGLAYDGAGNLYVADSGSSRDIRKIAVATGVVSTVAGASGPAAKPGSTDGIGQAATFTAPRGLAYDGAGALYVSEDNANLIRKVVIATGAVTTVAGSGTGGSTNALATAATFSHPAGLACDGAGNLYVADSLNAELRKIVLASGDVTSLAGLSSSRGGADGTAMTATFTEPVGLALDRAGHLFVAEVGNSAIREVALATGAVTTLAGGPFVPHAQNPMAVAAPSVVALEGPAGLVYDRDGNLFVADRGSDTIRKISVGTGAMSTLAGSPNAAGSADGVGAAARFSGPSGLAYDGLGTLFVADNGNHTIREVAVATGAVTTLVGKVGAAGHKDGRGAAARFETLAGLAYDGVGSLYATSGNAVRKIAVASRLVTTLVGSARAGLKDGKGATARFNAPDGLVWDGAGHLFVSEAASNTIRKVDVRTRAVTTVAGTPKHFVPPHRRRGAPPPPLIARDGKGAEAHFLEPAGLALDGTGHLFVADSFGGGIRRISVGTRAVTTLAANAVPSPTGDVQRFGRLWGVAYDGAGSLYVSDSARNVIRRVALTNGAVATLKLGGTP